MYNKIVIIQCIALCQPQSMCLLFAWGMHFAFSLWSAMQLWRTKYALIFLFLLHLTYFIWLVLFSLSLLFPFEMNEKKTALDSTTISNIFAALGMFAFDFAAAQSTRIVRCDLLARLKYFVIYEFLLFKINGIPCILCIALFFLAVTEKTVWITFFLAFYERAFCLMHWINIFFAQQKKSYAVDTNRIDSDQKKERTDDTKQKKTGHLIQLRLALHFSHWNLTLQAKLNKVIKAAHRREKKRTCERARTPRAAKSNRRKWWCNGNLERFACAIGQNYMYIEWEPSRKTLRLFNIRLRFVFFLCLSLLCVKSASYSQPLAAIR